MNSEDAYGRWTNPESLVLLVFLAVLAWAPFPYGSNRLWAELVLGVGLGAALLAWAGSAMSGLTNVTSLTQRLGLPALLMVFALGWGAVQSLDLEQVRTTTGLDVGLLAHPVWSMTSAALKHQTGAYVSVSPELTREALFAAGLSIGAFLIAFELGRYRACAEKLLAGVVAIGVAYAALAFAETYLKLDMHSWLMPDPKPLSPRIAGPFVNPNHFATFMALCALAALGVFVENFRQAVVWDRGMKLLTRTAIYALSGPLSIWLTAIVVLVSALLLTQSRGGVVAFLLGLIALVAALAVGAKRSAGEASGRRAMAAILVAVVGVAAAISLDPLLGRVRDEGVADSARASLAQSAMDAVGAAPLLGHGFGAFQRYYPFFADGSVQGDVDEVHNDILETLSDLGLPAGLAYMAAPGLLAGMCFAGSLRRRRDRVYSAVGFAAAIAVGAHAFVDFSLQIPAIAMTFAAVLGVGVAQSWRTSMDMVR